MTLGRRLGGLSGLVCSAAVTLLLSLGCGTSPSGGELDEAIARESLEKFLSAWQEGRSPAELSSESPAIVGADDEWQRGRMLVGFRFLGEEFNDGRNLHLAVELQLSDGRRRNPRKSHVGYVVGTSPVVTIFRQ